MIYLIVSTVISPTGASGALMDFKEIKMRKLFTDNEGRGWEAVLLYKNPPGTSDVYTIRPVQKKWLVTEVHTDGFDNFSETFEVRLNATEEQAQAIKQSVEELMKYLTGPKDILYHIDTAVSAKKAIGSE